MPVDVLVPLSKFVLVRSLFVGFGAPCVSGLGRGVPIVVLSRMSLDDPGRQVPLVCGGTWSLGDAADICMVSRLLLPSGVSFVVVVIKAVSRMLLW